MTEIYRRIGCPRITGTNANSSQKNFHTRQRRKQLLNNSQARPARRSLGEAHDLFLQGASSREPVETQRRRVPPPRIAFIRLMRGLELLRHVGVYLCQFVVPRS